MSFLYSSTFDTKFLSILVANGIPIVGLLAFGMSAPALLSFYWLEFGVLVIWAIVRATFAGKRRETGASELRSYRGGWAILQLIFSSRFFDDKKEDSLSNDSGWADTQIPIPRTNVGIYLGTIPALVFIIPMLAVLWFGFGGVIAGPVVAATNTTNTPTWILTGAGIIFLSEGGQMVVEYFYRGRYQETTVWMAVKGIFWQGFALLGAGLVVLLIAFGFAEGKTVSVENAASGPLIFVAVAGKLLIDLTTQYLEERDQPLEELI